MLRFPPRRVAAFAKGKGLSFPRESSRTGAANYGTTHWTACKPVTRHRRRGAVAPRVTLGDNRGSDRASLLQSTPLAEAFEAMKTAYGLKVLTLFALVMRNGFTVSARARRRRRRLASTLYSDKFCLRGRHPAALAPDGCALCPNRLSGR